MLYFKLHKSYKLLVQARVIYDLLALGGGSTKDVEAMDDVTYDNTSGNALI